MSQFTSFVYLGGKIVQFIVSRYKQQHRSIHSSLGKISASDSLSNVHRNLSVAVIGSTCGPGAW